MAANRWFDPAKWFTFVETAGFSRLWDKQNLTDADLWLLQAQILRGPKLAPVIERTGGLRKLRFSPSRAASGKRDAFRVCYVYFELHKLILLVIVYPKNQKDDLSPAEKKQIRQLIARIEGDLGTT